MGVLAKDNRQLIFIYSEDSRLGELVLPHVKSIDKAIRLININTESISNTIWVEIAALLEVEIKDLFSKSESSTTETNRMSNYSVDDWLKIINKSPSLLQNPIAINGPKVEIIEEKHDIFSFYNTTGANFDKSTAAIKSANHQDTTI